MSTQIVAETRERASLPLTYPALTGADVINVCEFITGESYTTHHAYVGGCYRDVVRPANSFSDAPSFLLVADNCPGVRVARWGDRIGEPDPTATRAFTVIARALTAGLLHRGPKPEPEPSPAPGPCPFPDHTLVREVA